jgi:hypothetical protein
MYEYSIKQGQGALINGASATEVKVQYNGSKRSQTKKKSTVEAGKASSLRKLVDLYIQGTKVFQHYEAHGHLRL